MKYQLQYWLKSGELIEAANGVFATVLIRLSDDLNSLTSIAEALHDEYQWSILEQDVDGGLKLVINNQ